MLPLYLYYVERTQFVARGGGEGGAPPTPAWNGLKQDAGSNAGVALKTDGL